MDAHDAIAHARRLLEHAEMETDLAKMKACGDLADSWLMMASLLQEEPTP